MPDSSDTPKPTLNQLVIIGLGLIGASIASAVSKRRLARKVIGISRRSSTLELALEAGIIDCLLYTSPSPRDVEESRMPSSA